MTGYYLTFNDGIDFELYGNLKLGNRKLKQQDWFMLEPQTMSFDIIGFPNARGDQETLSNAMIHHIFIIITPYNGLVRKVIKLYYNGTLLFTGVVDLTQSKYSEVANKATVVCYDYIKVLSVIKDNENSITDNIYVFSDFLALLQSSIDEFNAGMFPSLAVSINSSANKPIDNLPEAVNVSIDQKNASVYNTSEWFAENANGYVYNAVDGHKYNGCLFFVYVSSYLADSGNDDGVFGISYEYILYSLRGLSYSVLVRKNGFISYWEDSTVIGNELTENLQLSQSAGRTTLLDYIPESILNMQSLSNSISIDNLIYSVIHTEPTNSNTSISITGNMFSYDHAIGKYLSSGYDEENETGIIDVLKMYLMANNQICYSDNNEIKIVGYEEYATTHVIADDDILEISNNYIEKKKIDKIQGINAETDYWLKALNLYYSGNIGSVLKTVSVKLEGNETIKAGDNITNVTHDFDLFVIEKQLDVNEIAFDLIGV